uniref:Uncharacterized protein n=1 Tax=Parascaris equorum TaxID=6256 RepID=A0A914RSN5_PAREQ
MVGPIRTENERATEKYVENMRKQMETASKKNRPLTIRQKHKAQKIKKKYADQEEDERIMRAIWLGSREVPTKENQGWHMLKIKV